MTLGSHWHGLVSPPGGFPTVLRPWAAELQWARDRGADPLGDRGDRLLVGSIPRCLWRYWRCVPTS